LAVPAEILPNPVARPEVRRESQADRLLFIGTTQPAKGFALFISVCAQLGGLPLRKIAYLSDEIRQDRALVEAAHKAGVETIFGEHRPDILYRDAFLLLVCSVPSARETFSLTAAEAMVRGVPVAGAGVPVLREVLDDALAFDVPTRDPVQIAAEIAALHANDGRIEQLKLACERRSNQFSEGKFVDRLLQIVLRERQ
jgi:glycosyltransferase involved in cell wall biosynthesis